MEIRGSYLLISHVPYVDAQRSVQYGTLVSAIDFAGDNIAKPGTHVVYFIGTPPCHKDGSVMTQIQHSSGTQQLGDGIVVNHSFSHKPASGYADYYEKMARYIEVISAPARSLDRSATAATFRVIESQPEESVFNYIDTNSSRAEIVAISEKLMDYKIGIIGLGGTGGYVLDLVAKTLAEQIHLFDGDKLAQHNAFRAPGAPTVEQLRVPGPKVDYFAGIYSNMHCGIHPHCCFVDATNVHELRGLDFVFMCIDDGRPKRAIIAYLEANSIPFIDVGMGVHIADDSLIGILRITPSTAKKRDHVDKLISFDDAEDDEYSTNIQIAELNMLSAALAVIKWKKLLGFYQDLEGEHNCTYSINLNQLLSDNVIA